MVQIAKENVDWKRFMETYNLLSAASKRAALLSELHTYFDVRPDWVSSEVWHAFLKTLKRTV